jgi:phage terminase large subunit-like protein
MDFQAQGDLIICADPTQDLREVAALCAEIKGRGLMPAKYAIGLDPYGVTALQEEMAEHGLGGELLAAIPQGSALSPAIWGIERKLNDGTLVHASQPLMDWAVSNAKVEQRGSAVMITKAVAGRAKIDPLMALFNAAALMGRNPVASGGGLDDFLAAPVMVI